MYRSARPFVDATLRRFCYRAEGRAVNGEGKGHGRARAMLSNVGLKSTSLVITRSIIFYSAALSECHAADDRYQLTSRLFPWPAWRRRYATHNHRPTHEHRRTRAPRHLPNKILRNSGERTYFRAARRNRICSYLQLRNPSATSAF